MIPTHTHPSVRTLLAFTSIMLVAAAGGCQKPYGDLGEYSTAGSETGGESSTGTATETPGTTTVEPECQPGEVMNGQCSDSCVCGENGTWGCTDKGCVNIIEGFEKGLTDIGGCSDMVMYAGDVDNITVLHLGAPGMVKHAKDTNQVIEQIIPITDPSLTVEVLTGSDLGGLFCNDVVVEASIDLRYVPIAGEVTIKVTPIDGPDPAAATATATFKDVLWQIEGLPDSEPVPMAAFTIGEVAVGWLPG